MSITKTLILTAFACGDVQCPRFASVQITQADIDRIEAVRGVCEANRITIAVLSVDVPLAAFGLPTEDFDTDYEREHRVFNWELHLFGNDLWWRGEFKHSSDAVETHMISMDTLKAAFGLPETDVYIRKGVIDPTLAAAVSEATA